MSMSERDRKLLMQLGMTEEQVERDAARVESETESDNLTGRVYYGLHLEPNHEDKVTVSLRIPRATLKTVGCTGETLPSQPERVYTPSIG